MRWWRVRDAADHLGYRLNGIARELRRGATSALVALISGAPERFFVPPYVGHRGWVGLRLDLPDVDWDEVAGVIEDAHAYALDRR